MRFRDAVDRVEDDDAFSEESGYLVHGFRTYQDGEWSAWQIGYYDESADTVTPYTVDGDAVSAGEAAEVFKRDGTVRPLEREAVALTADLALEKAHKFLADEHPGHRPTKTLLLVQALDLGQVYNVTVVTDTLHMLNVKMDSETGAVKDSDFSSILSLRQE